MENMTVSNLAMAVVAAAGDSAAPGVHDGVARTIVTVLLVGVALVIAFTFCALPLLGFVSTTIIAGSVAAAWMASIGVVAAGSLFALLQVIAAGGALPFLALLGIVTVVAVVVGAAMGAFEAIVWLLHAVDVLGWWHSATDWVVHLWDSIPSLLGWWHSATDWVVHLWDSIPSLLGWWHSATDWVVHLWDSIPSLLGWWHSATDWVGHLWDSIPAHHKWKILYT